MSTPLADPVTQARFIGERLPVLCRDAYSGYKSQGRGMLLVWFPDDGSRQFRTLYTPVGEMREKGFSAELLGIVETYEPSAESVLCVDVGDGMRVLKVTLERPTDGAPLN